MSLQIVSNGTIAGTHICHAVTGQAIEARRVEVIFDAVGGIEALVTSMDGKVTGFDVESIKFSSEPRHDPAMEAVAKENDRRRREACPECGGTGEVQLFTSTVPCSRGCRK